MKRDLLQAALTELHAVQFVDEPIPRQVFMTARDKTLHADAQRNLAHMQAQNPGWQFTVYDDQDIEAFLNKAYGPAMSSVYRMLTKQYGAARADFFRYLCVYWHGGIYLDLKSTTTKPFDEWLNPQDRFILSQWDNGPQARYSQWGLHEALSHVRGGEYQQWFLAASKGHVYLRAACERVIRNILSYPSVPALYGRPGVLAITGPIAFTLAIHPIVSMHPHRWVDVERDGGLLYSFYEAEKDHFKLGHTHYSSLREPIVALSPMPMMVFRAAQFVQEWLSRMKRATITGLVKVKHMMLR
jgi:mannosyltransferase OCH1-like enzyme